MINLIWKNVCKIRSDHQNLRVNRPPAFESQRPIGYRNLSTKSLLVPVALIASICLT